MGSGFQPLYPPLFFTHQGPVPDVKLVGNTRPQKMSGNLNLNSRGDFFLNSRSIFSDFLMDFFFSVISF